MTGFGLVRPLPGIWPSPHLDTAITLPIGVEAYAAYALRAWLARDKAISARTRRFAKWSAIGSFGPGMAGQVAYPSRLGTRPAPGMACEGLLASKTYRTAPDPGGECYCGRRYPDRDRTHS